MWAYKVIRLTEQPRTLPSGKWAGLVLDSCSWEWWPYVSLATGLVFWLRSFICGNTCLHSEGWCCKFKTTWRCIWFTRAWAGSAGVCLPAPAGTGSDVPLNLPLPPRGYHYQEKVQNNVLSNQQGCIYMLLIKPVHWLSGIGCQWEKPVVR